MMVSLDIDQLRPVTRLRADVCFFSLADWVPLSQRGKEAGDVYLELTFYSAVSCTCVCAS